MTEEMNTKEERIVPAIMTKHCKTSVEGRIALSDNFVNTAIREQNCSIRVTCDNYAGEESIYSVDELLKPSFSTGPYQDKFSDNTYFLYMYPWKGTKIKIQDIEQTTSEEEFYLEGQNAPISQKKYVVRREVLVPTYIDEEMTLAGHIANILKVKRESLGLTMKQVATEIKVRYPESTFHQSNLSKIESGVANPQLMTLEYICEVLGLHISELFPSKEAQC